jgi:hypothetical protein
MSPPPATTLPTLVAGRCLPLIPYLLLSPSSSRTTPPLPSALPPLPRRPPLAAPPLPPSLAASRPTRQERQRGEVWRQL